MKNIYWLVITLLGVAVASPSYSQDINWASIQDSQRHIASLNVGWDYAIGTGLGYAYKLNTKIPVLINGQVSLPAGKNLFDDFKSKLGVQARVYKSSNFQASAMIYGIFRRTQSDAVTLQNFGGEFSGVAGYYRKRWFAAGEFGYDKAIATYIRSGKVLSDDYPSTRDGWYVPTGGNFHAGIQAGYTLKDIDLTMKAGRVLDQNFKVTATVPFYFQFAVNWRF